MKSNLHPIRHLSLTILFVAALCARLPAQDTNEVGAAVAELEAQRAAAGPGVSRLFVNAPDPAARRAAAEARGQAATAARQSVKEEIELLAEGAIARFGPHQVIFPRALPAAPSNCAPRMD